MPLVLCSIGLEEVFEKNSSEDDPLAIWEYCREIFEQGQEVRKDAPLYAEGGEA